MIDVRRALTLYLRQQGALTVLLAEGPDSILQEDAVLENIEPPFVVLSFVRSEPHTDFREFVWETWDIWLVTSAADYYTLGSMAKITRAALDQKGLDAPLDGASTTLYIEWFWDGPALSDTSIGIHAQTQRYLVLRQN